MAKTIPATMPTKSFEADVFPRADITTELLQDASKKAHYVYANQVVRHFADVFADGAAPGGGSYPTASTDTFWLTETTNAFVERLNIHVRTGIGKAGQVPFGIILEASQAGAVDGTVRFEWISDAPVTVGPKDVTVTSGGGTATFTASQLVEPETEYYVKVSIKSGTAGQVLTLKRLELHEEERTSAQVP